MSKSLFSVTPDPLTGGGIFSALQSLEPPWVEEDIALQLDLAYYGNFSGGKIVSPLIDRLLTGSKLTTSDVTSLAGVLMAINKERWSREWATRSAQYDPIENYNMTEEMTDDETVTDYGHTRTRTDNLTRTTTPNLTEQSSGDVYGFNSSNAVHSDKQTGTTTGTSTDHDTGTQTDADTGSDTSTRNYTLTRSGNIGVTTTQQMLQSERDLWMWSYFYDVVFPDVDDVLTVPVYADDTDEDDGRIIPKGTISIVENGTYDVKTYASASVNVPQPAGDVTITTNGTHDVTQYVHAIVQVPNTYTEADEGKVVSSGALVSQTGPYEITENGTYDTELYSSVDVNLPEIYTPVLFTALEQFNPASNASSALTGGYTFTVDYPYKVAGVKFFPRDTSCNLYLARTDGTVIKSLLDVTVTPEQWNTILFDELVALSTNTDYIVYGSNGSTAMKYLGRSPVGKYVNVGTVRYSTTRNALPTTQESGSTYGIDLLFSIGI